MKRYIIVVASLVLLYFTWDYAYYRLGWYIDLGFQQEVSTTMEVRGEEIYQKTENGEKPFQIRGVNLGSGIPAEWATDFAIEKDTYLRWFAQIQELGANVIRVYTIQADQFYEAFY